MPFSPTGDRLHVAGEDRLERLLGLPLGMLVRLFLHLVDGEDELVVHRHLDPQRAVIVEGGETVLGRDVVRPALLGHAGHVVDDGLLGHAVVP
jgi:hypothetical protein